jgi:hypothetical protein
LKKDVPAHVIFTLINHGKVNHDYHGAEILTHSKIPGYSIETPEIIKELIPQFIE